MKRTMKRMAAAVICLMMTIGLLTACNNEKEAGGSGDKIEITFMGWGYESEKAVYTQMIQDFMAENPDISVKYIVAPDSEYDTKLNAMMQAGTQPDVFFLRPENLMAWADAGMIMDLQSMIESSDDFPMDNIWPKAIDRYRYDGNQVGQGNIWALPKDVGPWSMVYNKDLFAKCGVTPPTLDDPWTWDEFVENAKKLTFVDENGKQIYGAGYYMLEVAVWSNGADFLSEDGKTVTVDTPEFAEAMQWVADLRLKEKVMPSAAEEASVGAYARWVSGSCAMFAMGPWDQAAFWDLDFEWDLMPWPVSPNTGVAVPYLGSAGYAISPKSAHTEAAFKLAAYFSGNREGQTTNYQMGQAVPNLMDMAQNEYMAMEKSPASKEIFFDIIENGRGNTQERTYNGEWVDEFWLDANKVWTGELSAAEYCAQVQPRMQALLDKAIQMQQENRS